MMGTGSLGAEELQKYPHEGSDRTGYLSKDEVEFLVFEGGGGKGFAFLGALRALEQMKILKYGPRQVAIHPRVKGFAGSSAGAIMALLLSCGYSPKLIALVMDEMKYLILGVRFKERFPGLFDIPKQGQVLILDGSGVPKVVLKPPIPSPNGQSSPKQNEDCPPKGDQNLLKMLLPNTLSKLLAVDGAAFLTVGVVDAVVAATAMLFALGSIALMSMPILKVASKDQPPPFNLLTENSVTTINCLINDLGVFCGDIFLDLFARIIKAGKVAKDARGWESEPDLKFLRDQSIIPDLKEFKKMNFDEFERIFQMKLGVMASDLSSHKSVLFSKKTTPKFPVAAAVRISMSLPLVFKPFFLTTDQVRDYVGEEVTTPPVYIDGGLFNNVPLTVIDDNWGSSPGRKTLALQLSDEEPASIDGCWAFLKSWLIDTGMYGSGESQIHRTLGTDVRSIPLKTDGLNTLDFCPPSEKCAKFIEKVNGGRVFKYFGSDAEKYQVSEG